MLYLLRHLVANLTLCRTRREQKIAMTTRAEQKEKTRLTIIQAALTLSEDKGFNALSLREVTREANIAPATFYRHFDDMEELGLVLVDQVGLTLRQIMRKARQRIRNNGSVIETSVETFFEYMNLNPQLFRLLASGLNSGPIQFRQALQKEKRRFIEELADDLNQDTRLKLVPLAAELMVNQVFIAGIEALDKTNPDIKLIKSNLVQQLRMAFLGSINIKNT